MCKVLIIPAIKQHKMKETMTLLKAMGASMSKANSDGLGYAAINEAGELFGERWFVNSEAFRPVEHKAAPDFSPLKETADQSLKQFGKALKVTKFSGWTKEADAPRYNKFGDHKIENAVAITLHTRYATCEKGLMNVHPFVDTENDTSVIHNGVISNHKDFDLKLSTCDSESILISYLKNGVNKDVSAVQGMVDELRGYYACGVFSRDADNNRILDVFKYNNNNLSICYVYDIETYVLTSSDTELRDVLKSIGFSHDGTQDIQDNYLTRINPFTGEIVAQVAFASPPTPSYNSNYNNSNHYGPRYHGAEVWDPQTGQYKKKANSTTSTGTGAGGAASKSDEHKTTLNKKLIDFHLAKMMKEKSDIVELGTREVEEYERAMGAD